MSTEKTNTVHDLRTVVGRWVCEDFNAIPLDAAEIVHQHHTGELPSCRVPCFDLDDEDERTGAIQFCTDHGHDCIDGDSEDYEIEDSIAEIAGEQYPMWGTVFHSDDIDPDLAIAAGFSVLEIEGIGQCLGVAGAGYSFYSAHWIPLWLSLPWNDTGRERFAGVDYSGV